MNGFNYIILANITEQYIAIVFGEVQYISCSGTTPSTQFSLFGITL